MKGCTLAIFFAALVGVSWSQEAIKAVEGPSDGDKMLVYEVDLETEDQGKSKRQSDHERSLVNPGTQHIYGSAPGHYVLRTKEANAESEADYLGLLRQLGGEGSLQASAAQARPILQQYVTPREQQQYSQGQVLQAEPKLIQLQQIQQKRPLYAQNQVGQQQAYLNTRIPLVLRPSQGVRPSPVQGIYTTQGFLSGQNGHSLHEARVQAALSVADDRPTQGSQSLFQYAAPKQQQVSPLGDSTFEKELAELVAANQAAEYKQRPQSQPQYQQQQLQYVQQVPQKPTYIISSPKPKQYTIVRQDPQGQKYVAPIVAARAKQLPQQYLIETTKPQQAPARQVVLKQRPQAPQYVQASSEEPKYFDIQAYQERLSPMKLVAAPQLQRVQVPQQYRHLVQEEPKKAATPAYLQYYQAIRPQEEEAGNDVKIGYTSRFATPKAQPSTVAPVQEQPQYIPRYQQQSKVENPNNYVTYKAAKPQLVSQQYSSNDDSLIKSLIALSQQKTNQGLSAFASNKAATTEQRPEPSPLTGTSHSSIFVSKALAPKKSARPAARVETVQSEPEEEVQTVRLPPPKNNKVYTQEEFQALVDAGYSVTPVPVHDNDDKPSFSPAPENYPGHSQYQPTYATQSPSEYVKQSSEAYATATPAPRVRKPGRRHGPRPQYRLQSENVQAESESQTSLSYAVPLEAQESSNYGQKLQERSQKS